jgi:aerobic-type carbon monoxide dehydrogenase small subunit (CoxS/CutS family)
MASIVRVLHGETVRVIDTQHIAPTFEHFKHLYGLSKGNGIVATYVDDEGDCCSIGSGREYDEALAIATEMAPAPLIITIKAGAGSRPMSQPGICPSSASRNLVRSKTGHVHALNANAATSTSETEAPVVITEADEEWDLLESASIKEPLQVKEEHRRTYANTINFTVNKKAHSVASGELGPRVMLSEYLRYNLGLTGTKVGCGEGGCGACTVHITRRVAGKLVHTIANSCLRPVLSLDGADILTTEGLVTPGAGQLQTLHPIQAELAKCDGSQCGYCSPGMVMAMYGLLQTQSKPTMRDVEERFQGNICRCTGYRPIYKAMHSFASNSCGENKEAKKEEELEEGTVTGAAPPIASMLTDSAGTAAWYNPTTIADVRQLVQTYASVQPTRLTVGNTAMGVAK